MKPQYSVPPTFLWPDDGRLDKVVGGRERVVQPGAEHVVVHAFLQVRGLVFAGASCVVYRIKPGVPKGHHDSVTIEGSCI